MRVTRHEELVLLRTALEALRKTKYSRIMRSKAEALDGREYILLCNLIDRADADIEAIKQRALGIMSDKSGMSLT